MRVEQKFESNVIENKVLVNIFVSESFCSDLSKANAISYVAHNGRMYFIIHAQFADELPTMHSDMWSPARKEQSALQERASTKWRCLAASAQCS